MNQFQAIFVVVASMLGTGILATTGIMATKLGSLEILVVWVVGAVLTLLGALSYGSILSRYPQSGGEAVFIHRFYSPSWGYITAILSFLVGFAASNAAASMILASYFKVGAAGLDWFAHSHPNDKVTAILAIVLMTLVHALKDRRGMRVQTLLALVKLCLLAGVAVYGLLAIQWETSPLTQSKWQGASLDSWMLCILFSVFTYSGWNAAIYAAAEFKQPERTVPRAMLIGASLVITLYFLLNLAIVGNLPSQRLSGVEAVVALLFGELFGATSSGLFAILISIVLLSSIGVSAFAGPRVLHGILAARRGQPADPGAPVPARLLWLQAGASMLLIMSGTFEQIMTLMGVFLGIAPVLMVFGIYRRAWNSEPAPAVIRYLVAPLYIVFSVAIIAVAVWSNPKSVFFIVALVAMAFAFVRLEKR